MKTPETTKPGPSKVGEKVQSQCGACKALTAHIVIALDKGKPAQVRCNVCERYHNYRPAPKLKNSKAKKNPEIEEWIRLSPEWADKKTVSYDVAKTFKANDIVRHAQFGLGQVRKVLPPNKMRVLFESGLKLMVCGN